MKQLHTPPKLGAWTLRAILDGRTVASLGGSADGVWRGADIVRDCDVSSIEGIDAWKKTKRHGFRVCAVAAASSSVAAEAAEAAAP